MAIKYVMFQVSLHGLNITSEKELEELRDGIASLISNGNLKNIKNVFDSDIEVEIVELAGSVKTKEM